MKQVILVEDDPAICDSLSLVFKNMDILLTAYPNGEKILSGNYDIPDLFLLDKQLSGVDGLDICRFLKSQVSTRHIPVIIMSASPSVIHLSKTAGADDVIVKPYKLMEIRSLISKYL